MTNTTNFAVYGLAVIFIDVMNDVDCVIKRDIYRQAIHVISKNIRGI